MVQKVINLLRRKIIIPVKGLLGQLDDRLDYEIRTRRTIPILVYQMGKVGSASIHRSLKDQYDGSVLHAHSFSPNETDPLIRALYRWTVEKGRPLKVISLTREPVARNISAFFQNFERDTGVPFQLANFSLAELMDIFLSNYPHKTPLDWFDNNILANLGIDVFATPFPENGIATYSKNNVDLLVMQSEIPDETKVTAIREFIGLDTFRLQNTNIGQDKNYSETYKDFIEQARFPTDYINRMYDSKYARHFYSNQVIEGAKMKWGAQ